MDFYGIGILFCLLTLILYASVRIGIYDILRETRSKNFIRKHKKGFLNWLWYLELAKPCGVGVLDPLNQWASTFLGASILLHLLIGWVKPLQMVSAVLFTISISLLIPLLLITSFKDNEHKYGTYLVLFRLDEYKRIDSVFFDLMLSIIVPLFSIAAIWIALFS